MSEEGVCGVRGGMSVVWVPGVAGEGDGWGKVGDGIGGGRRAPADQSVS